MSCEIGFASNPALKEYVENCYPNALDPRAGPNNGTNCIKLLVNNNQRVHKKAQLLMPDFQDVELAKREGSFDNLVRCSYAAIGIAELKDKGVTLQLSNINVLYHENKKPTKSNNWKYTVIAIIFTFFDFFIPEKGFTTLSGCTIDPEFEPKIINPKPFEVSLACDLNRFNEINLKSLIKYLEKYKLSVENADSIKSIDAFIVFLSSKVAFSQDLRDFINEANISHVSKIISAMNHEVSEYMYHAILIKEHVYPRK